MPKYRSLAVVKARLRLYTDYDRKRSWHYYRRQDTSSSERFEQSRYKTKNSS